MLKKFTFIDLFAGIGGFHLAMHKLGGKCVFASEIDKHARKTYEHNFKSISPSIFDSDMYNDDIRKISPDEIPEFDILCAGFPCQPFSQAGHKKGFDDNHKSERGNLFFNIVEIIEAKQPRAFFLENVRGLINHDNGNTLKTIRDILENELGYSFYIKIVKASDYGLPQLRPRAFMIGFRGESVFRDFSFPDSIPLKFNMSDVWGGDCSREIGFTLRVGGRGSNINDRRNWDSYLVDGAVKKIMPKEAKMMQGFPVDFELPVPATQAMKQLGNSVAIDAIFKCGESLVEYLDVLDLRNEIEMKKKKNKGEWTEIYSFFKLINEKKLYLADSDLAKLNDFFSVTKVTTLNIDRFCDLVSDDEVNVGSKKTGVVNKVSVKDLITEETLGVILDKIKYGKSTFEVEEIQTIQDKLGLNINNGGNSNQKADIVIDIHNDQLNKKNEGFGIKSYIGSKPTLLNASGNTNFIFKISGFDYKDIDKVNCIDTVQKIKDRISKVIELGGNFEFKKVEKDTMHYNLSLVDSNMPMIASKMLMNFYLYRKNKIKDNIELVVKDIDFCNQINETEQSIIVKVKRLLSAISFGIFPGVKWDGDYSANGMIVVKEDGDQLAFHVIDKKSLENYLVSNVKFDTPSSSRHRFGKLFIENKTDVYFKLNMQLRF